MTKSNTNIRNENHAIVVLVRGLPGSGKSYITEKLVESLGDRPLVVLDPDTVDTASDTYKLHMQSLQAQGVSESLYLYRYLRGQAYDGIASGKLIIWNQPFTNLDIFNKMVANFRVQAEEHGVRLSVLVVEVEVDAVIARNRVDTRKQAGGHGPSDEAFQRFVDDYRSFAQDEYEVVSVRGEDATAAVAAIVDAIVRLD